MQVPVKIKEACLLAYVNKCREVYQIAFFQHRDRYPSPLKTNMNELVVLIESRIEWTYLRNINADGQNCPDPMTQEFSKVGATFEEKYLDPNIKQQITYNINCFEQLGWVDPFPAKDYVSKFKIPSNIDQLVYAKERYIEGVFPSVIYVPR